MIYLDNAATTFPKPQSVYRETLNFMKKCGGSPSRGSHRTARRASEALYDLRVAAGEMFDCEPECVVFTSNATHALNLAIKGLATDGAHVLISDLEHNSVRRPVAALCRKCGCTCDVFPSHGGDSGLILDELSRLVREDTKLVVATHASNVSSIRLPVRAIGRFCAERGIRFVVDASQSAGHVPVSLTSFFADALCLPGHKGLYGPQGTGLLLLKQGSDIKPLLEGGTGIDSLSDSMPSLLPERLECGTLSAPLAAGLASGIRFVRSVGLDVIHRHECELGALAAEYLADIRGVKLYGHPFRHSGGVVLFNMDGYSPARLAAELDDVGICVRSGLHCSPLAHSTLGTGEDGAVRLSVGYFNSAVQIRRLAEELLRLSK